MPIMFSMDLPIACSLTEAELRQRRQTILDAFRNMRVSVAELPDGYAYTFPATSETLLQVAACKHGAGMLPIPELQDRG